MTGSAFPRRVDLYATDPDEVRDLIRFLYPARLTVAAIDEGQTVTGHHHQGGGAASVHLDMPADLTFDIEGQETFTFAVMLSGAQEFERSRGTERFGRGDALLAISPGDRSRCRVDHGHIHTIDLDAVLLDEAANPHPDQAAAPVRFLSSVPIRGDSRRWRTTTRFVDDLLADPVARAAPLVAGAAVRLLAAAALATFPNTAITGTTSTDRHDTQPDALRRAVAFIEANPDIDIALSDIARAAYVSPRAVQLAFRRHLDVTPMAYLRQVRLAEAHQELQDATTGDSLTVTAVAYRWGFANPSRFARQYHAVYGQAPSATLRG